MTVYAGRYSEDLQDRYGNGYRNATVAVETLEGDPVTLYADREKTAYDPIAGLADNEIKADSKGNLSFFADPGNYQIVVTPAGGAALSPYPVSVYADPLEPSPIPELITDELVAEDAEIAQSKIAGLIEVLELKQTIDVPAPTGIAAVDTAAIQGAYAVLGGPGTVNLQGGIYATNADLIPTAYSTLRGAGKYSTTIRLEGTNRGVYALNTPHVEVEDLTIDCQKAVTTNAGNTSGQQGIYWYATDATGSPGAVARRVRVINSHFRALHARADAAVTNPLTIELVDSEVSGAGTNGVFLQRATRYIVKGNDVHDNGTVGIHVVGGTNALVSENLAYNHAANHGILVNTAIVGAVITRNVCWNNLGAGNWGIVVGINATKFVVANNYCFDNAGNMTIDVADATAPTNYPDTRGIVSNNLCTGATLAQGISCNRADGIVFQGNHCSHNAQSGMTIYARNAIVIGNIVHHNQRYGIAFLEAAGSTPPNGPHYYSDNYVYSNNQSGGAWTDYFEEAQTNGPVNRGAQQAIEEHEAAFH